VLTSRLNGSARDKDRREQEETLGSFLLCLG
jgi:hypothetical protein